MQVLGEIIDDKIIVKKPKDIGRLYGKSGLGEPISGNKLQLDLIEGVFLLSEGKIKISQDKKEIDFQNLIRTAAQKIPDFEIKYRIFKDLRRRGYAVKICRRDERTAFYYPKKEEGEKQCCFISAFSERDTLDLEETKNLIKDVDRRNGVLWFGIVDEEGDITYYEVTSMDLKGDIEEDVFQKGKSVFLKNIVIVFDEKLSKNLHGKEFFGKPLGNGLQLSIVEALYLLERNIIDIRTLDNKKLSRKKIEENIAELQPDIQTRLAVFRDLKKRGLIVKTGFKFGAHFRAYTKHPDETHAEYLVHVVEKGFKGMWAEISRAVRLAHSVNKEIAFAMVDRDEIDYIKFGRLRP
jgi:tRNA-intron endonuclease